MAITNTRATPAPEQHEPDDVDQLGNVLPTWTRHYPKAARKFLAAYGEDPEVYPRGHEFNLRLMEAGEVVDKGAPGLLHTEFDRALLSRIGQTFAIAVREKVGVGYRSPSEFDDTFVLDQSKPAPKPLPAARSREEVEVRPDWLEIYPKAYAELLQHHGVATVAGSCADDYNRCLIDKAPADCADAAVLEKARADALVATFGGIATLPDTVDGDEEN